MGKKSISFCFSRKQVRANVQHEGGFLSALMAMAAKALPTLLTGLASGVIGGLVVLVIFCLKLMFSMSLIGHAKHD